MLLAISKAQVLYTFLSISFDHFSGILYQKRVFMEDLIQLDNIVVSILSIVCIILNKTIGKD